MVSNVASPLSVFISYSHRDEDYKDDLVVHLASLKRQGKILAWQDRDIEAGAEWDAEIKPQLESAEIILLLITPRFLASDYCYDLEMQRAVQRHEEGTARVIPIIVKPCDWQGTPFSKLQVVPKDAKPVTKWDDQDDAFLNVVQSIRRAVETMQAKKPQGATVSSSPSPVAPTASLTSPAPLTFSTYNPATFTGREVETATLIDRLQAGCRIVAIAGMTGIGKTTIAERVIANLTDTQLPYYRFSLDDRSLAPDFASSGAALLRTIGDEPTLDDQKDPVNLLHHILNCLCHTPCRVQIDSLERLLRGDEQEGWSEFCDPLWLDLLQKFLTMTDCPSQLLLTTQDIPADLDTVASRYPQFWHCEPLQSLNPDEQRTLFQKLGLNPTDADWKLLDRIGAFYDGHPLVLQVIAEELRQPPFRGNIARYWQRYEAEFTAAFDASGNKLDRSRFFRRRVRQRVEQSLQSLPEAARQLLCACSVFRRPVPEDFWYAMLPEGDAQTAFDTLLDRHFVDYAPSSDTQLLLVRQHNLIRSIAYDMLKVEPIIWRASERRAADLWLNHYDPNLDASNIEKVRGHLEAINHYSEIGDWDQTGKIYLTKVSYFSSRKRLDWHLETWGYYQEKIQFCTKLLGKINLEIDLICFRGIGNAWSELCDYSKAIDAFHKSLDIAFQIGNKLGEGKALGNLGETYYKLGDYKTALDFQEKRLQIAHDIGDRSGEGGAMGTMGRIYHQLGDYSKALEYHQKDLEISREIEDYRGEASACDGLGKVFHNLTNYSQAIENYARMLLISRRIGDRLQEGRALCNLGESKINLKYFSEAIDNLNEALKIFHSISNKAGEAESFKNLAAVHQVLGEIEIARQYAQQALALATELGIPLKAECEALLVALEQGEG
ncbi:MAG: tetratricopeptide repeat protein [Cyanobacteria bacterium P01_F01_bin.86]